MKPAILLLSVLFSFSTVYGFGARSPFRSRNNRGQTEAGPPCIECNENGFRADGIQYLPEPNNIGLGMKKALTNLYGFCKASRPLTSIELPAQTHRSYSLYPTAAEASAEGGLNVPGIGSGEIARGFDHVRKVNPAAPAAGVYASQERGSRQCTNTVNVGGERIRPSQVPKMFGNGASGRYVDREFGAFSCASQNYLNSLTATQKAYTCGMREGSAPGITMDCAELIGLSATASCKKLHQNQRFGGPGETNATSGRIYINGSQLNTTNLTDVGNDCLKQPEKLNAEMPILQGDIFIIGGDSFVITEVQNDPFNITEIIRKKGDCRSVTAANFRFSFGQSSSYGSIGPMQAEASAFSAMVRPRGSEEPPPLSSLVAMARKMCEDGKRGRTTGSSRSFIQNQAIRQLRHNSTNPSCSYPPGQCPKSAGDECANYCGV